MNSSEHQDGEILLMRGQRRARAACSASDYLERCFRVALMYLTFTGILGAAFLLMQLTVEIQSMAGLRMAP